MTTKVSVRRHRKDKNPFEVEYNFGRDAQEAVALFGGDVVHAHFLSGARQELRDALTKALANKKPKSKSDSDVISEVLGAFKPSVKRRGKSAVEKVSAEVDKLTPEERRALLRTLQPTPEEASKDQTVQANVASMKTGASTVGGKGAA